jgi:hypothetical protein
MFFTLSGWSVGQWNELQRGVTADILSYYGVANFTGIYLGSITFVYHYSNGSPGAYWVDDVSISTPAVNATPMHTLMNNANSPLGDINGDGKVNLADLVLLANAYGTTPANTPGTGQHQWNPRADLAAPHGRVGLKDLVSLAVHYGQHYP